MKRSTRIAIAGAVAVVALGTAGAVAVGASQNDDDETDTPIVGADLQRASDAALAHTGQGRVTGTEVGDEESYYEVEVTLDDGKQVDVQLDKSFHVVDANADSDTDSDLDDSGLTARRRQTPVINAGRCRTRCPPDLPW